jgi:predicted branched-subunit amino acid permease
LSIGAYIGTFLGVLAGDFISSAIIYFFSFIIAKRFKKKTLAIYCFGIGIALILILLLNSDLINLIAFVIGFTIIERVHSYKIKKKSREEYEEDISEGI